MLLLNYETKGILMRRLRYTTTYRAIKTAVFKIEMFLSISIYAT